MLARRGSQHPTGVPLVSWTWAARTTLGVDRLCTSVVLAPKVVFDEAPFFIREVTAYVVLDVLVEVVALII